MQVTTNSGSEPTPFEAGLGLSPALVRAAGQLGFTQPTAIQSQAIPAILHGADVLASAQTGSGKTAAFALPLLQVVSDARLEHLRRHPESQTERAPPRPVRALVLVPTRELAAQVGGVLKHIAQLLADGSPDDEASHGLRPLKIATLHGGVSINPQMMGLRGGADVVVATTGRLLDLLESNALRLSQVQHLVLDEADRMLDLGFAAELAQVLAPLPARRQNLFFSATLPAGVQELAAGMLHKPVRIDIEATAQSAPDITQRAIAVDPQKRTQLLRHLVQTNCYKRVLVFTATKYTAHTVAEKLRKAGVQAAPFHADLAQGTRTQVLEDLKTGKWDVVVTTDLASRGIDVLLLNVVFNYDLPRSADDYTHRIGRTGRAGASGLAISFVSAGTEAHMSLIEKRHGLNLPREHIEGFEPTLLAAPDGTSADLPEADFSTTGLDPKGGIKGKRPSKKDKLRAAANELGAQSAAD